MERLKAIVRHRRDVRGLADRVAQLEQEIQECRQVNLRLAELIDVVAELLVPLSQRDEAGVDEALSHFRASLGGQQG